MLPAPETFGIEQQPGVLVLSSPREGCSFTYDWDGDQ